MLVWLIKNLPPLTHPLSRILTTHSFKFFIRHVGSRNLFNQENPHCGGVNRGDPTCVALMEWRLAAVSSFVHLVHLIPPHQSILPGRMVHTIHACIVINDSILPYRTRNYKILPKVCIFIAITRRSLKHNLSMIDGWTSIENNVKASLIVVVDKHDAAVVKLVCSSEVRAEK